MENYLTLSQAGEIYNVSPATIRKMFNNPSKYRKMDGLEEGKDYIKLGKTWFITKQALNKMYIRRSIMGNLNGIKWRELSKLERKHLLKEANCINGTTGNSMLEDGECIVDLTGGVYSIPGRVEDGEIIIEEDSIIYNPAE